jgi:small subunit ribosomal protein S21
VNGVRLRNNENIEKALSRFKKVVERGGVLYDMKKYRYFEKPSETKKEARKAAKRKIDTDR